MHASHKTLERSRPELLGKCFSRCFGIKHRILRASRAVGVGPLNAELAVPPQSLLMVNEPGIPVIRLMFLYL